MLAKTLRRKFFDGCGCCQPTVSPANPGRRQFLATSAATLGVGAAALQGILPAAAQAPARTRIDVHHHFIPPFHADVMMAPGRRAGRAAAEMVAGAVARGHGQERDRHRDRCRWCSRASGSATTCDESRKLARELNEYGAKTVAGPSRPLRPVRRDRAARRRWQPEGDRIRPRHAQGRRHRPADQLSATSISAIRRSRRSTTNSTAARRWSTSIRPRRTAAAVSCRASRRRRSSTPPTPPAPSPMSCSAAPPPSSPTSAGSSRTRAARCRSSPAASSASRQERKPAHLPNGPLPEFTEVLLRARPGQHAGPDRGAAQDGVDLAGAVRHRLPVPRRRRGQRRHRRLRLLAPPTSRAIERDNALRPAAAAQSGVIVRRRDVSFRGAANAATPQELDDYSRLSDRLSRMCSSRSCLALTSDGAPIIRSSAR